MAAGRFWASVHLFWGGWIQEEFQMSFRMLLLQGDHHLRRHFTDPTDYTERDQLTVSNTSCFLQPKWIIALTKHEAINVHSRGQFTCCSVLPCRVGTWCVWHRVRTCPNPRLTLVCVCFFQQEHGQWLYFWNYRGNVFSHALSSAVVSAILNWLVVSTWHFKA